MVWSLDSSAYQVIAGFPEINIWNVLRMKYNIRKNGLNYAVNGGEWGNGFPGIGPQNDLFMGEFVETPFYGPPINNPVFGGTNPLIIEDGEGGEIVVGGPINEIPPGDSATDNLSGGGQNPDQGVESDGNSPGTEPETPSNFVPTVPPDTETEEQDRSKVAPTVPPNTEAEENIDVAPPVPPVPPNTEAEENIDVAPPVPPETDEEDPSNFAPTVPSETEEDGDVDVVPTVPPATDEEDPSDLLPDVPPATDEEDPSDLLPDVPPDTDEEDPSDLLPDVPPDTDEEDPSDLEPDVPPDPDEEDPSDLEPDVPPDPDEEEDPEPISDEDETPPIEDEDGDDNGGGIEDEPPEDEGDDPIGDDPEPGNTATYADAVSGIIADLSEGMVTRLFTTTEDTPFKILPLGDSNTRGFPNLMTVGGYRTRLWDRLVNESGFNIDFVGQASSGPANIDQNHEGRGGFTITELTDNSQNFQGYNQPVAPPYTTIENALSVQPDAVLLMAGTNDILQGKAVDTAIADLGVLVDRIVAEVPGSQLLVASIIPNTSNNLQNQQRTREFSEKVYEFVIAPRVETHPNIRFVDLFNAPLDPVADYNGDGVHLNVSGYDKLADEWYSEIRMLPSGKETLTDIQNIVGSAYDDTLIGDDGANILRGGAGDDFLIGGAGPDTFVLASGEGTNTIADFESGIDFIGLADGLAFDQLVISEGTDPSETHIAINGGESLAILLGIDANTLGEEDFILV